MDSNSFLIVGKTYKFDNKTFLKEQEQAYGIDEEDSEFLFKNDKLEVVFFEKKNENHFDDIIYFKGMIGRNESIFRDFGITGWYFKIEFLNYLKEMKEFTQEEFDI